MLATTLEIIRSALRADSTVSPGERARLLTLLRNGSRPGPMAAGGQPEQRLVRRAEAARRLGCSLRSVDHLAAQGHLPKRKLPGRRRSAGFLESDLTALIAGGG